MTTTTRKTRSLSGLMDTAALLADLLAERAKLEDDRQLAAAATEALGLATDLHSVAELLATIAGCPEVER